MAISCEPLRQNLKRYVVDAFYDKFSNLSNDIWFLSIGRPSPWPGGGTASEDGTTPEAIDAESIETDFWRNVIAHKRITKDDVSLVIPKYDWISGKVYTPYRNNIDLYSENEFIEFYIVVDEERVYKCIDNYYNSKSVVPPTHTDTVIRKLSDGYRWKFLFSIPETKRKFITNTSYNTLNEIERVGYIPIDYVDFLRLNDERLLQWTTQQASIKGTIDFIELKETYKPFLITTNTLRSTDATNTIVTNVPVGATTVTISSSLLFGQNGYYDNMVFNVDAGNGQGQRRIIKSFTLTGSASGIIVLDHPLTRGLSSSSSIFSILPNIRLNGDGQSNNITLNPNIDRADVTISFGTGLGGSNLLKQTYVDSFEMVNTGKNYTYANLEVVKGLTFTGLTSGNLSDIGEIVISPFDGHGSDARKELGSAAIMVVTDFQQTENNSITVNNDYRQFGILKNPLLNKKTTRIRTIKTGTTGSFAVGPTSNVFQGFTGVDGKTGFNTATGIVVYWSSGVSGYTGSAELIVSGVSGDFLQNGVIYAPGVSFGIQDIIENKIAGEESRRLMKIKLVSSIGPFSPDGSDFKTGLWVSSVGNPLDKVRNTRFSGQIHRWEISPSSTTTGFLYVEYPNGRPLPLESLAETDYYMIPTTSVTGSAKVVEIEDVIESYKSVYDQTTTLVLTCDSNNPFTKGAFGLDSSVIGLTGTTGYSYAKVLDWSFSGPTTGNLVLFDNIGLPFGVGSGLTFYYGDSTAKAAVVSVIHQGDLKYKTGELEYIQNTTAITRNKQQREEIKVLFQF